MADMQNKKARCDIFCLFFPVNIIEFLREPFWAEARKNPIFGKGFHLKDEGVFCRRSTRNKFIPFAAVFFLFSSVLISRSAIARNIPVTARAAVVMDGQTHKILYAKNPDMKLMPASTTKLITAMVVLDRLNPDQVVVVSKRAAYTPSIAPRLWPGARVTVRQLLYLALMRSINGAAVQLAETVSGSQAAFARLMNAKAASLGATDTRFVNATGLPAPGQYITAENLAIILDSALKYPLIKQIINTKVKDITIDGRRLYLANTDRLLWSDGNLIGGKTGYTRAAEHCLVFAASEGDCTIVTSLLGEPIRNHLWSDGQRLLNESELVVSGQAKPEIYETHVKSPVVLTSYESRRHFRRRIIRHFRRPLRRHFVRRRFAKRHIVRRPHLVKRFHHIVRKARLIRRPHRRFIRHKYLRHKNLTAERRVRELGKKILNRQRHARVLRARRYHKRKYVRA